MEVGIEESLHIEFEYNRSKYHLKDVIVGARPNPHSPAHSLAGAGKIYFLLVRIKIKYMELAIIKRETTGSGMGQLLCAAYACSFIPTIKDPTSTMKVRQ